MSDEVNHPAHYNQGKMETIDICDAMGVAEDGCIFNVIKYLSRFQYKHSSPAEQLVDLKKAQWYLNWLVAKLLKDDGSKDDLIDNSMHSGRYRIWFADEDNRRWNLRGLAPAGLSTLDLLSIYDAGIRHTLEDVRGLFLTDPATQERIDQVINSLTT